MLETGTKLTSIFWVDGEIKLENVKDIEIVRDEIIWGKVVFNDGRVSLYNLSQVEGITLKDTLDIKYFDHH